MKRRLVLIWKNSSLIEHLPPDLLHGDKQVANKELLVMENQGTQDPCCFQREVNANTNTPTNTKSWLWWETRKCSAALFSKGNPPPPRGKCMLRWLAPLSHKYKALLSDKYKRHCLCTNATRCWAKYYKILCFSYKYKSEVKGNDLTFRSWRIGFFGNRLLELL